jgi:hypothetical protein
LSQQPPSLLQQFEWNIGGWSAHRRSSPAANSHGLPEAAITGKFASLSNGAGGRNHGAAVLLPHVVKTVQGL